jgi:hypothetical protein
MTSPKKRTAKMHAIFFMVNILLVLRISGEYKLCGFKCRIMAGDRLQKSVPRCGFSMVKTPGCADTDITKILHDE